MPNPPNAGSHQVSLPRQKITALTADENFRMASGEPGSPSAGLRSFSRMQDLDGPLSHRSPGNKGKRNSPHLCKGAVESHDGNEKGPASLFQHS